MFELFLIKNKHGLAGLRRLSPKEVNYKASIAKQATITNQATKTNRANTKGHKN